MQTVGHIINGETVTTGERTAPVYNPALGSVTREVLLASQAQVEQAVAAAKAAFPAWRDTPPLKRAQVMFRYKQLLESHAEEICQLITEEHGKVLADAMGELQRGIEVVEYACGIPDLLKGEHNRNVGSGVDSWSEFRPLGVVAGITPFNFPAMVPMWMFPLAIACGNCFILKPSERTPSSTQLIANLLHEAGLPKGVFNLVNGDREAVESLLQHPDISAISFVGSTPVAESIYQIGNQHGKRVQALGGAKNHAVVMPDADLENAANALMGAAYGSCGERCMAISVVVCVGDETADALTKKLSQKLSTLKVGPGTDPSSEMGPLVTPEHFEKVKSYIDAGESAGATLVTDGRPFQQTSGLPGYFLGGTLFDHVTSDMSIYREEIFGPVLCVVRVDSLQAAIQLTNDHEYGNGTCIFTRDGAAAHYFSDHIEVGMVGINVPLPVPVAYHSFGGWKRSRFGDLAAYGPDAVRFYTRRKTITQRWPAEDRLESASYAFPSNS